MGLDAHSQEAYNAGLMTALVHGSSAMTCDRSAHKMDGIHSPDKERAKRVIVEILRMSGGNCDSTTRIFKTFYYAHLFYAQKSPGYLTDWPIVALEHGPGVGNADELFAELIAEGVIERRRAHVGPHASMHYRLLINQIPDLEDAEIQAIREAVKFLEPFTPAEQWQLTHDYSRSWNQAKQGDELNIYIDLLDDDEFEKRRARMRATSSIIDDIWTKG